MFLHTQIVNQTAFIDESEHISVAPCVANESEAQPAWQNYNLFVRIKTELVYDGRRRSWR